MKDDFFGKAYSQNYFSDEDKVNISEEFTNYLTIINNNFDVMLNTKRIPYYFSLNKLYKFYIFCSYLLDKNNTIPIDNHIRPIINLYCKSANMLFGIYSCLNNGLILESSLILRSIFELYINIKLILEKDTLNRLKLYNEYGFVEKKYQLDANKKLIGKNIISKDTMSHIDENEIIFNYNTIKNNYKKGEKWWWNIYKNRKKNGISLQYVCEDLGCAEDYVKLYSTMSILTHTSPLIRNIYEYGNKILLQPQFNDSTTGIAELSFEYTYKIIYKILSYININNKRDILYYMYQNFPSEHPL